MFETAKTSGAVIGGATLGLCQKLTVETRPCGVATLRVLVCGQAVASLRAHRAESACRFVICKVPCEAWIGRVLDLAVYIA